MNMSEHTQMRHSGLRGELRRDEPMARHVSWRAGGRARCTYAPVDLEDLALFLRGLPAHEPVLMVGLGSNLLVRDGGLDATVIFTHWALRGLRLLRQDATGGELWAQAGVASPKIARFAALHALGAAEFFSGIPGTFGGALAMNAGCYGGETWNVVIQVETMDRAGNRHVRTPQDYSIGYRSVARRSHAATDVLHDDEWFIAATLRLPAGDSAMARTRIRELLARRIAAQPLGEPNAGSVFRNPPNDHAARLIEACGLKGHVIGGAAISAKHANFIVNQGDARAADIEALIDLAQQTVQQRCGVLLEREVRIVGERA